MDDLVMQALLYDFYGELLTEHQRAVYEDFIFNDLSLGEIAQQYGISRQGVHDLVKRCGRQLAEYESRLHLVARFMAVKDKTGALEALIVREKERIDEGVYDRMLAVLHEISEDL